MDYKEKYEKALATAERIYESATMLGDITGYDLAEIFPELRESEGERIRKELIGGLMWQRDNLNANGRHDDNLILPGFTMRVGDLLAYLEKQKESLHISETCKENADSFTDEDERVRREILNYIKVNYRWANKEELEQRRRFIAFLEKKKEQEQLSTEETELNSIAFLEQLGYTCIHPGKEQKPIVLDEDTRLGIDRAIQIVCSAKGKLYGYQSDDGIYECDHAIRVLKNILENGIEQKPAEWSENDKRILDEAIGMIEARGCWVRSDDAVEQVSDFLKSLPYRFSLSSWGEEIRDAFFGVESHWMPSEEEIDAIEQAIRALEDRYNPADNSFVGHKLTFHQAANVLRKKLM